MQGDQNEKVDVKVYELAIFFARMWGVAETLESVPNIEFKMMRDKVMEWAKECIACQEKDFVKFFQKKMKEEAQND